MPLAARRRPSLRLPTGDRFGRKPDSEAAAIAQRRIIVPPVRHPMALTGNVMTALGIKLERHDRPP